ncbi:MAG: thiamine phosphate synthase [Desulfobacterales bacterium]
MATPVDRFKAARTRIYCCADSLDLCGTLLAAGARLIQLRAKTADDTSLRRLARGMLEQVRRYPEAVLIVNDRVDLVLDIVADGVAFFEKYNENFEASQIFLP